MVYRCSLLKIFRTYTLVYLSPSTITSTYFYSTILDLSILNPDVGNVLRDDFTTLFEMQNYLFWLMIVTVTLIALPVNDKYRPGVFATFLLGKYFHPKREEPVFFFFEFKRIYIKCRVPRRGPLFQLLRYATKTVILNSKVEIYRYVVDEIVFSRKRAQGTENANALRSYFDIQKKFKKKADYYEKKYSGRIPEFKAGLHFGYVMAGEIGIVKRDIAYSGNVLNTASRIQVKYNELNVDILNSKYLLDLFGS